MRKPIVKTKMGTFKWLAVQFLVVFMPFLLLPSQLDESLVDDVTAMITNAAKMAHTTFLLDTSENMNTFAYSDYIDTCKDAKANINSAIILCDNAYNQCRNVEANAMCGVNLGCGDILTNCTELRGTRIVLNQFCADVESLYAEPGTTTIIADPLGAGVNDAKKFVGPWDPRRADYLLDLCFYDWTEDTGGEVLTESTSGHYSNPNDGTGKTDRRDWDCLTDGISAPQNRGGLWLNWKYATSLDAVKVIMGNVHDFSYPPRARGERKCILTQYFPYYDDPILGKVCYKEFETNPADPLEFGRIKDHLRTGWTKSAPVIVADTFCPGTEAFTIQKDTVLPHDLIGPSILSNVPPCNICRDAEGNEVSCKEYIASVIEPGKKTTISGISAEVEYSCCINYECTNPKCRDDDSSCRKDALEPWFPGCVLGYYSDFDQDPGHCCDKLSCVEEDFDASGVVCESDGTYIPGPGNDVVEHFEDSLGMPVLGGSDEYQNVELTAVVKTLTFAAPIANVSKVIVSIYYGCDVVGETPSNKITQKEYSAEVTVPDAILSGSWVMEGCEQSGYKVGGTMQVFHSGANYSSAVATMDIEFTVAYNSGSDQNIYILNPGAYYYYEYRSEATGDPSEKVNEYECKTVFYHKQSYVQSGGSGGCNWTKIFPKPDRCVQPDHTTIAADQWGSPTKTACSWLCRDDVVYDDVWKCRAFFTQMDNPARGGSGLCTATCPIADNPATPLINEEVDSLDDCCLCIHNAQATYNFLTLEPPVTVKFSAAGASLNCAVSGYEEGITSEGKRTYTSGYMAEVIPGHIKELGDSSYRLNVAGYVSPYEHSSNQWFTSSSLVERSNSFLANSFISLFETGKTGTRDIACIYDLMNNFEGTDCDDGCGVSGACGCTVEIGDSSEMCDYPTFWMKIPNTEGGKLIYPAKILTGAELTNFKNTIRNLQAKGGSALGETLYDVWRYLGGMKSAHDPSYTAVPYVSPFQSADPACFANDAIIISGGQPQFDDNYSLRTKTIQPAPADVPWVQPDAADAWTAAKPYVSINWYLTAFERVASWVHTKDYYHSTDACRLDNNLNMYGFTDACAVGDTTGLNVIDKIHTIAIGEWALAPLYSNPANTYLEDSILKNAATNNGGQYFGLTAEAANQVGDVKTFNSLTDLFNQFAAEGSPDNVASGRPHWTSTTQPFGLEMKNRGPEMYKTVTIPIDNRISRFWFGNMKKYTIGDGSSGCNMEDNFDCNGWIKQTIPDADCFSLADPGADITQPDFARLMAGGAAKRIEERLDATGTSCDSVVGSESPCFTSGARNILYDDGSTMLDLKTADLDWFTAKFAVTTPLITKGQAIQILDYIYGYDAFDYDSDGSKNQVRYSTAPTVSVDDPFNIDFTGATTITIRPLLLGAITHSTPIAVFYDTSETTRIFAGANDGMLHSFDQDGNETFAYIPMPVLPALTDILDPREGIFFNSSVDGPVALMHIDYNNDGMITSSVDPLLNEKAYLIFGYRRGASAYTVLDISEKDNPKLVQHITTEGQSWAKPLVFRKCGAGICSKVSELTYYMALAGGYDPCFDADTPICDLNGGGHLDPKGNEIYIYKFNGTNFDLVKEYEMTNAQGNIMRDEGWMKASFVGNPIGVNTSGKASVNTEFIYLSDVSSTVFRVDVRNADPANWEFRAVFRQRAVSQPISWGTGIRTYTAMNYYPPLMKYQIEDEKIPIAITTGNLVNPKALEIDEMSVFYDRLNFLDTDDPIDSNSMKNMTGVLADHGTTAWAGFEGWKVAYLNPVTEKGITNPMMYYDSYQYNTFTLLWSTYYPNEMTQCRSFGSARTYGKNLINGVAPKLGENADIYRNNEYWDPTEGCAEGPTGMPDDIAIIDTPEGDVPWVDMGDDSYRLLAIAPKENATNIIKWYELY